MKVISLFQHGKEWIRFSAFVTACESQVESLLQAGLQWYIILSRRDRQISTVQLMAVLGSIVMIGFCLVTTLFANRSPGETKVKTAFQLFISTLIFGLFIFAIILYLVILLDINKIIFFTFFASVICLIAIYFCITRMKTPCQPQVSAQKLKWIMISNGLWIGFIAFALACLIVVASTFDIIPFSLNPYWKKEHKIGRIFLTGVFSFVLLISSILACCKAFKK